MVILEEEHRAISGLQRSTRDGGDSAVSGPYRFRKGHCRGGRASKRVRTSPRETRTAEAAKRPSQNPEGVSTRLGPKGRERHGPFKSAAPPLPGRIRIPGGRGGAGAGMQRARAAPVCGGAARLRPRRGDAPRGGGVSQVSAGTPRTPVQGARRWAGRRGASASQGCVTLTGHAPSLDQAASTAEARGGPSPGLSGSGRGPASPRRRGLPRRPGSSTHCSATFCERLPSLRLSFLVCRMGIPSPHSRWGGP